jgi:raffinose/stachyose/melibiose transport system substrate-binding protein
MFKKIISLVVAMLLLLSIFAGCGSNSGTKESTDKAQTSDKADDNPKVEDDTKAETVKGSINVFSPEVNTWPEYVPTINKFMQDYPDIKVDFSAVKHDQYITSMQTKIAASDIPDVFQGQQGIANYVNYIKRDLVMDLSDEEFLDRLTDVAVKGVEYEGKVYGIPINVQLIGIIYNKDMYNELNLSIPKTWQELLASCETLKNAGITPFTLGVKDAYVAQFLPYTIWPSVLYGKNKDFEDKRVEGSVKYDSPEWKKALEMSFDIFEKGYTNDGVLGISYDQMIEMFATEKAAMVVVGDWAVETIKKINPDINAGFFATPPPEGEDLVLESQTGAVYMISKNSKSPGAAKKFVEEFVTNPDYYYNWNHSPVQSLKNAPVPTDDLYKDFAEVYKNGKDAYPFINQNWINSSLGDIFCRKMQDVYAQTKTVDDIAKEFDGEFEKILPEYLKGN